MNKKIITFTATNAEIELFNMHPKSSRSFVPKWFKDIPVTVDNQPFKIVGGLRSNFTIKGCTPLMDAFTSGYIISLDSDIEVRQGLYGPEYYWPNESEMMNVFNNDNTRGFFIPDDYDKNMAKLLCKWAVETPKGYSLLITHPLNRMDLPFHTLSAVVDTDNFHVFDIGFVIKKGWTGILEAGTPIAQIIPFKRDNWKSEVKKYTPEIWNQYKIMKQKARDAYRRLWWNKKNYE